MRTILVIANQTIGGAKLLESIKEKVDAADGDARIVLAVPQTAPSHGNIIYSDAVFEAAQVRVDLARRFLRAAGINAVGEVGDDDPFTTTMDAVREHDPDEIVVSTLPATSSGWLRRDLIERIREESALPVEHVVIDMANEGLPFEVTLVVANKTASDDTLLERLAEMGGEDETQRLFIACVPLEGGHGKAGAMARSRKAQIVDRIMASGHLAAGIVGDPDPYTAVMNALDFFRVDDIVISTLPATRSGWLRADLIERVATATGKPVTHVEVAPARAAASA